MIYFFYDLFVKELLTLENPIKFSDFQEKFKAERKKNHQINDHVKAWVIQFFQFTLIEFKK